jgi:hypothetical protein
MNFPRVAFVCTCTHQKRDHFCTKQNPAGPCRFCSCEHFTPERICKCGHGEKAHKDRKGTCHEGDGCKRFRPVAK